MSRSEEIIKACREQVDEHASQHCGRGGYEAKDTLHICYLCLEIEKLCKEIAQLNHDINGEKQKSLSYREMLDENEAKC